MVNEIHNTGYLKMIYGFVRATYTEDERLHNRVKKQKASGKEA